MNRKEQTYERLILTIFVLGLSGYAYIVGADEHSIFLMLICYLLGATLKPGKRM